jgi:hypothetical protein
MCHHPYFAVKSREIKYVIYTDTVRYGRDGVLCNVFWYQIRVPFYFKDKQDMFGLRQAYQTFSPLIFPCIKAPS